MRRFSYLWCDFVLDSNTLLTTWYHTDINSIMVWKLISVSSVPPGVCKVKPMYSSDNKFSLIKNIILPSILSSGRKIQRLSLSSRLISPVPTGALARNLMDLLMELSKKKILLFVIWRKQFSSWLSWGVFIAHQNIFTRGKSFGTF